MSTRVDLFLAITGRLAAKCSRAASFFGVRIKYLAGEPLTHQERKILKSKGNPAIRMNDLFLVTNKELAYISENWPDRVKFCRVRDYHPSEWWQDPDRMVDTRPAMIRESWSSARSLALMSDRLDGGESHTPTLAEAREWDTGATDQELIEAYGIVVDDDQEDTIISRNQSEREDIVEELNEFGYYQGEDSFTDTEYPVLESQARFRVHGSNEDLDDLFGEEPRDDRGVNEARLEKTRQWRASHMEEMFQENPQLAIPSGSFFTEYFGPDHRFSVPLVTCPYTNKVLVGMFVTRRDFFEERDNLLEKLTSDYIPQPINRKFKAPDVQRMGLRRSYRGWETKAPPGPLALEWSANPHLNPPAPEKPALKKNQRWVAVAHKIVDGRIESYITRPRS